MTRTNAYSILCVMIRAFALWLFASTAFDVPELFMTASRHVTPDQILALTFFSTAFLFAVAALLWIYADKLARLALARPQQITFVSDVSSAEWQTLAFSVIGLWQAVTGLVLLAYRVFTLFIRHFIEIGSTALPDLASDFYVWVVVECFRIALGVALLFGARGLVGLIRRYRQIGFHPVDAQEPLESGTDGSAESGQPPSL